MGAEIVGGDSGGHQRDECRFVGDAKEIELNELWSILAPLLRSGDRVLWFAKAEDLRVLGLGTAVVLVEPVELKRRGVLRARIEYADITRVEQGHEWFDHFIRLHCHGDGISYRFNMGFQAEATAWIWRALERATAPVATPSDPSRAVIFLHGRGGPVGVRTVRAILSSGLSRRGYEALDADRDVLVEPNYIPYLSPPFPSSLLNDASQHLRDAVSTPQVIEEFKSRRNDLERTLAPFATAKDPFRLGSENLARLAASFLNDVTVYVENEKVRRCVRGAVLREWPPQRRVLLVAHSLGTVVAADLIPYLPEGCQVGVLTLGSPLRIREFKLASNPVAHQFPYGTVESWVNFFEIEDEVTLGRGLHEVVPQVLDLQIDTGTSHDAVEYLRHPATAEAVGHFLYGVR